MIVIIILRPTYTRARPRCKRKAMLASFLAPRLARLNIHYGWVIVAVTFLTMLSTAGAMGQPGGLHEFRDGNPIHPLLAKQARGSGQHLGPVGRGLFLADTHGSPSLLQCSAVDNDDVYHHCTMIVIIIPRPPIPGRDPPARGKPCSPAFSPLASPG